MKGGFATVDCSSRQLVRTAKIADDGASWALLVSIHFSLQMFDPNRGIDRQMTSVSLENYQILRFLRDDLKWI